MRGVLGILVVLIAICAVPPKGLAAKRVALVIGNSAYTDIPALSNPKNDAELMADTLRALGFEVVRASDADRQHMVRSIRKFGRALRRAGKDAVGLFYYAGHGVQARGVNYLIPLGALVEDHADLPLETVSASDVLEQMESAGNRLNLVILDACRSDPFKGRVRSTSRGLARIQAASGALVAFAAAPGQTALDGTGSNSPYTAALAKAMIVPGLGVEQMFKKVRVEVESLSGGAQTPWEESSLRGDFYFTPGTNPAAAENPTHTVELTYWNSVKDSGDPALLNVYLERYPSGLFAGLAKAMVTRLKARTVSDTQKRDEQVKATRRAADLAYWNAVSDSTSAELLRSYMERFPDGTFVKIARLRIQQIEEAKVPANVTSGDELRQAEATTTEPETTSLALLQPAKKKPSSVNAKPAAPAAPVQPPDVEDVESIEVAAVDPEEVTQPAPDPDLPRKLQVALSKAGCNPGTIDGQWGSKSKAALERFAKHAKVELPESLLSDATLKLFEGHNGRICPLVCGLRQTVKDGRCVTKVCPQGQELTGTGGCRVKRKAGTATPAPAPTPSFKKPTKRCGNCRSWTWPKGSKSLVVRMCGATYREAFSRGLCVD